MLSRMCKSQKIHKIYDRIFQTRCRTFQTRGMFASNNTYKICRRMFEAQTNHLNVIIGNWIIYDDVPSSFPAQWHICLDFF